MALTNITEDGIIQWRCHHPKCAPLSAHISHTDLQWVDHDHVALPQCSCGSRTFVRVRFTDEELQADSTRQYGMVPTQMTVPHALTGEPVPVMIPALKAIGPNPGIARHQKLCELLEANGKPAPAQDAQTQTQGDSNGNAASAN
jgi:hypothetical protein